MLYTFYFNYQQIFKKEEIVRYNVNYFSVIQDSYAICGSSISLIWRECISVNNLISSHVSQGIIAGD